MTFARLEILAQQYSIQGMYHGHKLHVSAALSERLLRRYANDAAEADISRLCDIIFGAPLLYQLMGIPIINDVGMTDDPTLWILVDATGEEVERGHIPLPFEWFYGPTEWDSHPGSKWHKDCNGEVMTFDGVHTCLKCNAYDYEEAKDADTSESSNTGKASGTQAE